MTKRLLRKTLIAISIAIALIIVARLLLLACVSLEKRSNHAKVQSIITQNLTYETDTLDEQLSLALDWVENRHLYDSDKGRLCERISLIYLIRGEELAYYRYLGYALYYLEQSGEKDYSVNIYLDLANFYINNYSYDAAKRMIDSAMEVEPFEEIESFQIKSYAYRIQGELLIFLGEYEEAEKCLQKSLEVTALSDTGVFEEGYKAITEVWLARLYFESGRRQECERMLMKYADSPIFTQDSYRELMIRDFVIPYEETKCLYIISGIWDKYDGVVTDDMEQELVDSSEFIEEFIKVCEENGYEKHEFAILMRLQTQYPAESIRINDEMYANLKRLYLELLEDQNTSYSEIIDSQIEDSVYETARDEARVQRKRTREIYFFVGAFVLVVLLMAGMWMVISYSYDGLTQVLNRRRFDLKLASLRKRKQPYGILMMDIDNFKRVNDVYGHQAGDRVLQRLGKILAREETAHVQAYRYGGEEFVIILKKEVLGSAQAIAQRIRTSLEHEKWDFDPDKVITLSLGLAGGSGDEDVVSMADANLYTSKNTGKNRVTGEIKK